MKFPREQATEKAAMPHQFDTAGGAGLCDVCATRDGDPRHVIWLEQNAAREKASTVEFPRETGS